MSDKQILTAIENASSITELFYNGLLPEPNDDGKFYFFYYPRTDFKAALKDIVMLSDSGLNIWYDRKQENGSDWEETMLERANDFHCAAVVFYLSDNVVKSDFFWRLCDSVMRRHINFCSVKVTDKSVFSSTVIQELTPEQTNTINKMFGEEITYVPYSLSAEEKKLSIERIGKCGNLVFTVKDGSACVLCTRDLSEEEIIIPATTEIGGIEYPVLHIAPQAFLNCGRLKTIIFPDQIESIGEVNETNQEDSFGQVFSGCNALEDVTLPAELKILIVDNFRDCPSLKRLLCGTKIEKIIGDLRDFEGLEELRLPPIVKRTQEGNFLYHAETWQFFGSFSVANVYGYENITLPEVCIPPKDGHVGELYMRSAVLRRIDARNVDGDLSGNFFGCENLEEVILPTRAKNLCCYFKECKKLDHIELPNTLESIGHETFNGGQFECGEYIFLGCKLKTFTIPEDVNSIDRTTFCKADVETLISNSRHNDEILVKLFAKQNEYTRLVEMFSKAATKKNHPRLWAAFGAPIIFFKAHFRALALGHFWALALILTFPISFWFWLFHKDKYKDIGHGNVGELYLKSGSYKKAPRGWKRAESSMRGYERFIMKRGWRIKNDENALKTDS